MATNHTQNYNLNLWEPTDTFLRTEFNENTQKIDDALVGHDAALANLTNAKADAVTVNAALAQKADAATVNAALNQKADTATVNAALNLKCRFAAGGYTGNGAATQHITIGFRPKVVFVWVLDRLLYEASSSTFSAVSGLFVDGAWEEDCWNFIVPTSTGFNVRYDGRRQFTNCNGKTFNYIAFA